MRMADPGPGVVMLNFPQFAVVAGGELPLAYSVELPEDGVVDLTALTAPRGVCSDAGRGGDDAFDGIDPGDVDDDD
eukprot:gene15648-49393_t